VQEEPELRLRKATANSLWQLAIPTAPVMGQVRGPMKVRSRRVTVSQVTSSSRAVQTPTLEVPSGRCQFCAFRPGNFSLSFS
jgi:hypothetical protein